MGKGAEADPTLPLPFLRRAGSSFTALPAIGDLADDINTLRRLWFAKKPGASVSHAARLDAFYKEQAATCECVCRVNWRTGGSSPIQVPSLTGAPPTGRAASIGAASPDLALHTPIRLPPGGSATGKLQLQAAPHGAHAT